MTTLILNIYIFFILLFAFCLSLLIEDWIVYKKDKNINFKRIFLYLIGLLISAFLIYYITSESNNKNLEDLRYKVTNESITCKFEFEPIKEMGKETKYEISTPYGSTVISEDIFNESVGKENNVITIEKSNIFVYIGNTYPFGIATNFNPKNEDIKFINKNKIIWPWETPYYFTEEDAKEMALLYLDEKIEPNGQCCYNETGEIEGLQTFN